LYPLLKLNFKELFYRCRKIKTRQDPYDTFDWITSFLDKIHTRFFFLIDRNSKFDGRYTYRNLHYRRLIERIKDKGYPVGLHPSYLTFNNPAMLKHEINELKGITSKSITTSRQHYLKYQLPLTYASLIEQGIKEDYSICPYDFIGFKTGMASPYPWFNLAENEPTSLILHPAMVMDVSLRNYLKWDTELAYNRVLGLIREVEKVNGQFVMIWHNSNLSEAGGWKEWRDLFVNIVNYLKQVESSEH
jgi:hypothetical protein